MGTRIALDCGSVIEITKTGAPEGTTIIVKDLFFNVPARKKFLNSPSSEATRIAELMEELPDKLSPLVFRVLPKELASEVFVHIEGDTRELLIASFSDAELKEVLDDLYIDDTVDIIEEMPASVVKRILKHSDPQMRDEINKILNYPKDSAGSWTRWFRPGKILYLFCPARACSIFHPGRTA